jgi:hypothetical protein
MMNRSAASRIVGAFVFPEFWENSSDVPSNLAALRDVGVNAIMTESDRYDFSTLEATHNSGLRFYAGVACFSDHAANFRFIEERPELWPILESGERRPQMEWYVGMTPTDSRRQQQVLATIGSIARTYPVDGLFLDFVRWPLHWEIELRPGQRKPLDSSFDPATLVKFEAAYGAFPDPWPKDADEYTGAYLAGAIITDSGQDAGIGGCANLKLTQDLAKYAPVYAYEFGHRAGPGLTREHGAYEWGAGHAAELSYLFPSFNNGEPITPLFNAGERVLAESMKGYWGAFVRQGSPATRPTRPGPSSTQLASSSRSRSTIGLSCFRPSSSDASTTANSGTRTSSEAKWRYPPIATSTDLLCPLHDNPSGPLRAKTGHSATAGRCIKSTYGSPWSKASGFETRKLAAILPADIVGRLTGADKDRMLACRPRY